MSQTGIYEAGTGSPKVIPVLDELTFKNHLEAFSGAPEWLLNHKRENWETYRSLPTPSRKDENWRFSSVGNLATDGYHLPGGRLSADLRTILSDSRDISSVAGSAVFVDDTSIERQDLSDELKATGVIWTSLSEVFRDHRHADLLQQYFSAQTPDLGSEKYQALHSAFVSEGTFIYVPRGVEIDLPMVSYHWSVGDQNILFPHTLIIAEDNARVNFVDIFRGAGEESRHRVFAAASIFAGSGAQVFYKAVQEWNLSTLSFHLNTVTADRDSNVKTVMLSLGSKQMRNEQHTRIVGAGCNVENYSLSVASGDQEFDQRTLQTHSAPHARSDLLYKNALLDNSRTVFSGLIKVDEVAQQTDAYQTNRNLVLSDSAESNALPGLEILANDVKCSHGATTGKLDEEQLFYLLARGVHLREAQKLLVFGFFEEILEKLENEELAENVRRYIQQKFHN